MSAKNMLGSAVLFAAMALGTGCVVRAHGHVGAPVAVVEVDEEPPPPRVVVVPAARPGFVWIQGRWVWGSGRWTWRDGYWERERAGQIWVQGRWERRGNRHVWVDGQWRAGGNARGNVRSTPAVRDHRSNKPAPAPGPRVRDHRR
jgi:hypothetical protein